MHTRDMVMHVMRFAHLGAETTTQYEGESKLSRSRAVQGLIEGAVAVDMRNYREITLDKPF